MAQEKGWIKTPVKAFLREVNLKTEIGTEELLGLSKKKGVLRKKEFEQRSSEAVSYIGYKKVKSGQLISNKMQAWNGMFGISAIDGITSPDYAIYDFSPNVESRFIEYIVRTNLYAGEFLCRSRGMGTGFLRLNPSEFLSTHVWLPDITIQTEIADFLDRETARIDQLIEKKVGFISVLKEKSTALVTENVLQGHRVYPEKTSAEKYTHPDKFWPDGLNGLLQPVKFFCEETASLSDKTDPNMEIHYVDIGNVSFADGLKKPAKYLFKDAPSRARQVLRMHDVIISTVRTYLKACAYIDKDLPNLIASTGFCVLRPNDKIHSKYLYRAIQSDPFISGVVVRSEGVSYPAVNDKMIKALKIPVPDLGLQKSISDKIEQEIQSVTQTIRLIEKSIDLLSSFKSSLITEAVTGKLDINSWRKRGNTDERLDNIEESMRT
ncbi:TPA: hypothetical protein JBF06_00645 [Legionella pneumophila]|nr:hypothetical protein [Legionella pneumophila]